MRACLPASQLLCGLPLHASVWQLTQALCGRVGEGMRRSEIEGMGAIVVAGDALDTRSLDKAFDSIEELDAVISTVGGTSANPKVDGEVRAAAVFEACHALPGLTHPSASWCPQAALLPRLQHARVPGVLNARGAQGNINIINAAIKKGVKKFILVTSIGVGDSKDAPPKQVGRCCRLPLFRRGRAAPQMQSPVQAG